MKTRELTNKEIMVLEQVGREYAKALNLCITRHEYDEQKAMIDIVLNREPNDKRYYIRKGLREMLKK